MISLYGHLWVNKEGKAGAGLFETRNFKLWEEKTEHLTDEQWKRGIDRCESDQMKNARGGKESWPPSYAEFIGFCDEESKGIYKVFPKVLPESAEYKSKRKRAAEEGIKRLNSIFGD